MNSSNSLTQTIQKNSFKNNFSQFLLGKDLLNLILAVYLGTVLQDFFQSLVEGAILPILMLFIPESKYTNFEDIQVKIHGVTIEFGKIIMSTIKLFIGFLLSYIVVTHFVKSYLEK